MVELIKQKMKLVSRDGVAHVRRTSAKGRDQTVQGLSCPEDQDFLLPRGTGDVFRGSVTLPTYIF